MNNLNINNDSRNRGLEVLLYQPEKNSQSHQNEQSEFKLKFKVPLFFRREFQFEFYINKKPKLSEEK